MAEKKKIDIRTERLEHGLSRVEFANLLGVSYRTVDAWENGKRNPSQQVILLIESGVLD